MADPLTSILMPVRNAAPFLEDCLQSILIQSEQNWELLAVNDHSTDQSLDILEKKARSDARIRVLNNDGKGIIAALRKAYHHSNGILITRMDADDLMVPDKIKYLKQQLTAYGPGYLSTGQVHYFSETQLGNGYFKYQNWLNKLTAGGTNFREIYRECVIPSPCWMVHRKDLDNCGAFQSAIYPEDYDLCFRFYQSKLKVLPSGRILHQWRDHTGRTSRNHEHYADNRFLELKLHYFLQLDYQQTKSLVLWGAGKKGKWIARQLLKDEIPFLWICNNEKKIGKQIYGQTLLPLDFNTRGLDNQFIVTVAGDRQQLEIKNYFLQEKLLPGEDYFFFC